MTEALRFPRGVRFASEADMPRGEDRAAMLAKIAAATITAGFVRSPSKDPGFSTYFEANVHADSVWQMFETLAAALLPEVVAPLIGWKDEEAILGPCTDKVDAIAIFRPHIDSLQHDGFIQFGLMHQSAGKTEEILVKQSKYFQVWTNQPSLATAGFTYLGIPETDELQFIDEFAMVTGVDARFQQKVAF